ANVEIQIGTLTQPEGDNLWTVRLFYRMAGSDANQLFDLQGRAKLTREVGVEPAAMRLAGKPGLAHVITLTDRRAKPLEVTGVAATSERIIAAVDSGWQKGDGCWTRAFRVTMSASCPSGKH